MRQNILKIIKEMDLEVCERQIFWTDIEQADEIYLTNAIRGIQWVREVVGRTNLLENTITKQLSFFPSKISAKRPINSPFLSYL